MPRRVRFVAFDDDRDERSTSPDHRHRCYAESPPAPRALAHQEAYCLASAFPVCPTFQDWARREAARTRGEEPPTGEDDSDLEPVVIDRPPRRGSSGWSSPPPWSQRGSAGSGASSDDRAGASPYASDDPSEAADAGMAAGAAAAGLVGAAGAMGAAGAAAVGSSGAAGPSDAGPGGLSGSYADRLASGGSGRDAPGGSGHDAAGGRMAGAVPGRSEPAGRPIEPGMWDDEANEEPSPPRIARSRERLDARPPERGGDGGRGHDDAEHDRDAWAPAWERPRRLEAYPTLRAQRFSGLGLSSLLIAVVAILLAAVLLFFLPSLLGIGSGPSTASPTPSTAVAPSQALESVLPSAVPVATAQTYVVQPGDTLSRIANKFHVPLQALIDANKTNLPNPDKLQIGDVINIPTVTPTALPAASS